MNKTAKQILEEAKFAEWDHRERIALYEMFGVFHKGHDFTKATMCRTERVQDTFVNLLFGGHPPTQNKEVAFA